MRLLVITFLILLTGCARVVWVKEGSTEADFNRDRSACTAQAAAAGDPIFAQLFLPDCMRGKGWTTRKVE